MDRRAFITLLGGVAAWPITARAQQAKKASRIGFLSSFSADVGNELIGCFRKGLEQLGWVEGQNINIEYRWAEGRSAQYAALAAELARLDLDLIACNSTPSTQALQRATKKIPIVFMSVSDPVASDIVTSLGHPTANITGVSNFLPATTGKLLELLKTVAPNTSRVLVLRDPANAGKTLEVKELQTSGPVFGLTIQIVEVRNAGEVERAISSVEDKNGIGTIILTDPVTLSTRELIAELAMKSRLPTIFQAKEYVEAGGLMSYGLNFCGHFRRAATYVDKILKGARPADLPVELPTTFELAVNLKTAKAIGVTVPPAMLSLADKVIE